MKPVAMIMAFMACAFTVSAQMGLKGLGVGFEYNKGTEPYAKTIFDIYGNTDIQKTRMSGYSSYYQFLLAYTVKYNGKKKDYFVLKGDLLQGGENQHGVIRAYMSNNGDTVRYHSLNYDIQGSTLGCRVLATFRAPRDKRLRFNYSLGSGIFYTYNTRINGHQQYNESLRDSAYYHTERHELNSYQISNYYSLGVIQQISAELRLSMKEKQAPLNTTFFELGLLFRNNFTSIESEWMYYFSYGFFWSAIYEFNL